MNKRILSAKSYDFKDKVRDLLNQFVKETNQPKWSDETQEFVTKDTTFHDFINWLNK